MQTRNVTSVQILVVVQDDFLNLQQGIGSFALENGLTFGNKHHFQL